MIEGTEARLPSRRWGKLQIGATLSPGLTLAPTGVVFPPSLPSAEAAAAQVTALSLLTDPSSVKLGPQTVLRGVLGIAKTRQRLADEVLRFFMCNAPSDRMSEINAGNTYRTRRYGLFALGFIPSRNVLILVQFKGTASLAATRAGSAVSLMIPVALNVYETMFDLESFGCSIGTSRAKNMDVSLQRSESGKWVTKGQSKVNAIEGYVFKISESPTAAPGTYRLVLANSRKTTTYSNKVKAIVGAWKYLADMTAIGGYGPGEKGLAIVTRIKFSHSVIQSFSHEVMKYSNNYATYNGEIAHKAGGNGTRLVSGAGVRDTSSPNTRWTFSFQVDSVTRLPDIDEMGIYDQPKFIDMQFPLKTVRIGLMESKVAGPVGYWTEYAPWGDARVLCSFGT